MDHLTFAQLLGNYGEFVGFEVSWLQGVDGILGYRRERRIFCRVASSWGR
jgi:hypothetical protein